VSSMATLTSGRSAAVVGQVKATIDNAIYSWWVQPVAVNDGTDTWVGGIAKLGTVRVAKVHRETGAVQFVEISRTNRPDDHNAPAFAIRPDGKYAAVLNGRVVYEGYHADGATVKSIERDRVTLDVSGNDVRVRVTGAASTTVEWLAELRVLALAT